VLEIYTAYTNKLLLVPVFFVRDSIHVYA